MIDSIQWLGHGSFLISGPPLIYINPWRLLKVNFLADAILIGHHHHEHFSPQDIAKLRGPETKIITNAHVARELDGCTVLRPWQTVTIDRAAIKALPAYSDHDQAHPKSDGGLGFLISLKFFDIYYAGDTGLTEEMYNIHPDIAILPIDDNDTLSIPDAVEAIKRMRPRWVIPCNYSNEQTTQAQSYLRMFEAVAKPHAEIVLK
jgi:L-ascorbate metabolism protein UlaG (beta-lactamase superfamily)